MALRFVILSKCILKLHECRFFVSKVWSSGKFEVIVGKFQSVRSYV